tara:strand:- start:1681 stop:1869 length:189 start_codon:yes stop_codon:yes gene_type:complete
MTLDQYLTAVNTSKKELAKQLKVSEQTVFRWCDGSRHPDRKAMQKIYRITRGMVTPNDLVLT